MNTRKIVVDNITKIYNIYNSPQDRLKEAFSRRKNFHSEFYALKNVCFSADEGEVIGIMGSNGAGKSTLLKIITGVLQPTYGEVAVSGRISSLLELGAGFNPEYTGMENIYFYGTIMGMSREEMDEKVDSILAFAEIGDFVHQPVKSYSSGMFARLAFSCAINVEPDVLIVDEILSVGDLRFQSKCFQKFKEFKEKGVTILYVGHDISTMRSFCDRCIWLHHGEILDSGDPASISARYIEYMYRDDLSDSGTERSQEEKKGDGEEIGTVENDVEQSSEAETPQGSEEVQRNAEEQTQTAKPLAHWGTHVGLIRNVAMKVNGKEVISCHPMDVVTISFSIPFIPHIDYDVLSASFSIKNREGLDFIVKTTYESGVKIIPNGYKEHTISFTFQPRLTNGDYYLSLAVEDRTQATISYYEYLEGAKYFKVYSEGNQFGYFLPDIGIDIR